MAERIHKQKPPAKKDAEVVEDLPKADSKDEVDADLEDILDEIDSLLEENAQEFVKNYVQKGGE